MEDNKRTDLQDPIGQTIVDVEQLGNRIVFIHMVSGIIVINNTFMFPSNSDRIDECEEDVYIDCIKRIGDISKGPITLITKTHDYTYGGSFYFHIDQKNHLDIRWVAKNVNNVFLVLIDKKLYETVKHIYERHPEMFFDKDYKDSLGDILLSDETK